MFAKCLLSERLGLITLCMHISSYLKRKLNLKLKFKETSVYLCGNIKINGSSENIILFIARATHDTNCSSDIQKGCSVCKYSGVNILEMFSIKS